MEWISIKDSLPKTDEWVIGYSRSDYRTSYETSFNIVQMSAEHDGTLEWQDSNQFYFPDITYWMPLPPKPKENNV